MLFRKRLHLGPAVAGALFYFSFYGAAAAYVPFISVFYAERGLSGSEIGVLAAIGPLMALLAGPGLSALADRRGWRVRYLVLSLLGTALALLAVPLPGSFAWLLPIVALLAIVSSASIPVADSMVARTAARRGLSFGKMRLWGSVSWAVVAVVCGTLWQETGFFLMFPIASLLFLATIFSATQLEEDRPGEAHARPPIKVVIADNRLRVVLLATFALGIAMSSVFTFSGIYLDSLGGQSLVGLFAGVMAASELPVMQWSERITRRLGGPQTLVLAYSLFGTGYLGLAFIQWPPLLLGVALLQGLGFGLFLPTTVRLFAEWAPAEWSSTSQGILSAGMWGLAPLIASPLAGLIYDSAGAAAVFLTSAAVIVLAVLVLVLAQLAGVFGARRVLKRETET
ncbi:MAG: MFS transporter [Chloroflexota bacterium]|nr:MFS transporter [Chloroflexota bacterium]MDQ5867052.1 MFS transporter [Chloroflexota bacterium]